MLDSIIANTKNSKVIKSEIPDTYEEFKALIESGLYCDILTNQFGYSRLGTAYNKASVLPSDLQETLNLSNDSTPADALKKIWGSVRTTQVNGIILSGNNSTIEGVGTMSAILLPNNICQVDFSLKITTADTSGTNFDFGLDTQVLQEANTSIGLSITPITGGHVTYVAPDGTIPLTDPMGYGMTCRATSPSRFWKFYRVYTPSGGGTGEGLGNWACSKYPVNSRVFGTVYGTYTTME